jgi:hypothetical protein
MPEDFFIASWENASPEQMKSFTESKLLWVMRARQGTSYDLWARAELERRGDDRLAGLITSLTDATNKVHQEVAILNSSSDRLEGLTRRLNRLTWVLIILTFLAVVVPAGLDFWKAYHPLIIFKP